MGAGPPLALERYAAITALIDGGEARDTVVERAGLATREWQDAQLAWLKRLASEAQRDKRVLLDTFNELLVHYLQLVEQGEYERLWPVALGRQSEPEVAALLSAGQKPAGPGTDALPLPAAVQESSAAAALPFASGPAAAPPASVRSGAAPASVPYPASVRTPGPISVQLAPPSSRAPIEQTLDTDGEGSGAAALPFQAAPGSVRQPAPTSQRSGGLPFVSAAAQPAPPMPAPAAKRSRTEPPPVGSGVALPFETAPSSTTLPDPNSSTQDMPDENIRGTVGVDGLNLSAALPFSGAPAPPADNALPFGGASKKAPAATTPAANASAALPFQAPAKPVGALPFRAAPAAAPAAPGAIPETIEQGPAAAEQARDPLTGTMLADFDGSALNAEPTLTLEQFASITAEIRSSPEEQREAIRRRYGFDQAGHEREQLAWAGKLMSDPELNKRYAAKLREYRDYLARRGGSS